jgi:hypothetical protein
MKNTPERENFVMEWLRSNFSADVLNKDFHDAYHKRFGGKRLVQPYGASPVPEAQKILASMYKQGMLERSATGIALGADFPKWVYVYTLSIS